MPAVSLQTALLRIALQTDREPKKAPCKLIIISKEIKGDHLSNEGAHKIVLAKYFSANHPQYIQRAGFQT